MNSTIRVIYAIHADRAARFEAEAQAARIAREAHVARGASHGARQLRRAIGRSLVLLGARIAADPAVERCLLAAPGAGGGRPGTNLDGVTLQ